MKKYHAAARGALGWFIARRNLHIIKSEVKRGSHGLIKSVRGV